jgi:hypothetical protein
MNSKEKRRLKEIHRREKERKRALREAACGVGFQPAQPVGVRAANEPQETHCVSEELAGEPVPTAEPPQVVNADASATPGSPAPSGADLAETAVALTREAAVQLEEAKVMHTVGNNTLCAAQEHNALVTEQEALRYLSEAARITDEVIRMTRHALAQVPLDRLREAMEIVKEKAADTAALPTAQKRPRRATDPVVSLIKTGIAAASLQTRIIARLHPQLGKLRKAA